MCSVHRLDWRPIDFHDGYERRRPDLAVSELATIQGGICPRACGAGAQRIHRGGPPYCRPLRGLGDYCARCAVLRGQAHDHRGQSIPGGSHRGQDCPDRFRSRGGSLQASRGVRSPWARAQTARLPWCIRYVHRAWAKRTIHLLESGRAPSPCVPLRDRSCGRRCMPTPVSRGSGVNRHSREQRCRQRQGATISATLARTGADTGDHRRVVSRRRSSRASRPAPVCRATLPRLSRPAW